ncbi:MAG TPA: hypothetical protein VLZ89_05770 [Anaerolineales bacterium]|nr:hypothetical protein [Anaerolineales bacterium]
MRRGEIFWGGLLVLLGVLFFLHTAGYLAGDVFGWFWPFVIIAIGIWILLGGFIGRVDFNRVEKFSVPLQGAKEARLELHHGAGQIDLSAGANAGDFLTGIAGVAMDHSWHLDGDRLEVRIDAGPSFMPFIGPEGGTWLFRLDPDLPLTLDIDAGASRLNLDLRDLQVKHLSFQGGASRITLTLPARVENMVADLEAGAAGIDLNVPQGVGLRLRLKSIGTLKIDEGRFVPREGRAYQSADYDGATYRAEVTIEGGATSIRVNSEEP